MEKLSAHDPQFAAELEILMAMSREQRRHAVFRTSASSSLARHSAGVLRFENSLELIRMQYGDDEDEAAATSERVAAPGGGLP